LSFFHDPYSIRSGSRSDLIGSTSHLYTGHSDGFNCLIELKNGYLASGSLDETIKIWNTETGDCIKTFSGHSDSVNCLISLKNGYFASGSSDNTINLWKTN
jgi:WD40 repeat protein